MIGDRALTPVIGLLVFCIVFAGSPNSAEASTGASCGGVAPIESTCRRSFVLKTSHVSSEVELGHGLPYAGALEVDIESSTGHDRWTCASGGITAICAFFPGGSFSAGQEVTLTAVAAGAGSWRAAAYSDPA